MTMRELPPKFATWISFYKHCQKSSKDFSKSTTVVYVERSVNHETRFEYSVDYIKSMCFDEVCAGLDTLLSKIDEYDNNQMAWAFDQIRFVFGKNANYD